MVIRNNAWTQSLMTNSFSLSSWNTLRPQQNLEQSVKVMKWSKKKWSREVRNQPVHVYSYQNTIKIVYRTLWKITSSQLNNEYDAECPKATFFFWLPLSLTNFLLSESQIVCHHFIYSHITINRINIKLKYCEWQRCTEKQKSVLKSR